MSIYRSTGGSAIYTSTGGSASYTSTGGANVYTSTGGSAHYQTPGGFIDFASFRNNFDSGLHRIDTDLTINGTTVTPAFAYYASDASTTSWPARVGGGTLSIANPGTAPTVSSLGPLGGVESGFVRFNDGEYFSIASSSTFDITTEDIVFEAVFQGDTGGAGFNGLCGKLNGFNQGWRFSSLSNGHYRFTLGDTSTTVNMQTGTKLTDGALYHVIVFINRDENSSDGGRMYFQGGYWQSINGNFNALSGVDCTSTDPFDIGINPYGGSTDYSERSVLFVALWKQASWHQSGSAGPAEWLPIAQERFLKISGMYPDKADGTALPTTLSRNSIAMIDRSDDSGNNRSLFMVGHHWIRSDQYVDATGAVLEGAKIEQSRTNLCSDMGDTQNVTNTTVTADSVDSPYEYDEAYLVHEDSTTSSTHTVRSSSATASISLSSGVTYCHSVFVKAINRDRFRFHTSNASTMPIDVDVDLGEETVSVVTGDQAGLIAYKDSWYRVFVVDTATGTGTVDLQITLQDASGNDSFNGADQDSIYTWGWFVGSGGYPTSPVMTSGGTASRSADRLVFKGDDGNLGGTGSEQKGSMYATVCFEPAQFPSVDASNGDGAMFAVSDGGSNSDALKMFHGRITGDSFEDSAFNQTYSSGSIADGEQHAMRFLYSATSAEAYDGSTQEADVAFIPPNDLDQIEIGATPAGGNQGNGLVGKFRTEPKDRTED